MTLDLSCTFNTGREGKRSARIINVMKKQTDTMIREGLFRQATPTSNYSSTVGVFRFKITP